MTFPAYSALVDVELLADDARMPPIPTRMSLVKLFLELELYEPALLVLSGIMASDDQEVDAWYLEGWCFFLMAERTQENGGIFDDLTWEQLARDARDCLEACQNVSISPTFNGCCQISWHSADVSSYSIMLKKTVRMKSLSSMSASLSHSWKLRASSHLLAMTTLAKMAKDGKTRRAM